MLTANEFAKHFDLAILAPNTQEADILAGCRTAAAKKALSAPP